MDFNPSLQANRTTHLKWQHVGGLEEETVGGGATSSKHYPCFLILQGREMGAIMIVFTGVVRETKIIGSFLILKAEGFN